MLFGGRRIFICAQTRRIIFAARANNLYHTFPVSNWILESWNLSFRVHRFNNLEEQVSIFAKFPSPLVHRVLFSRGELHWINWK